MKNYSSLKTQQEGFLILDSIHEWAASCGPF